jgi:drug/metabolite transporter (DMT)-like permease
VLLRVVWGVSGTAFGGFAADDWVRIGALTVTGQLLGHSLMNLVLRSISPTIVSLATLFTVPGATLIAAFTIGESPPIETVPAVALLLAGTAIVISARERAQVESP